VFVRLFVLTATKNDFLTMFPELAFLEKKHASQKRRNLRFFRNETPGCSQLSGWPFLKRLLG
jgi:hypothetical protein